MAKPLAFMFFIYLWEWFMSGWSKDEATQEFTKEVYGEELAAVQFGATVKMGMKRKSMIIGQIYEYLRMRGKIWSNCVDQEGNVNVKVFDMDNEESKENRKLKVLINITFPYQYQIKDRNKDMINGIRWGSTHWAILISLNDTKF